MANLSAPIYEQDTDFRAEIIALLFKPTWVKKFPNLIKPEYFPTKYEQAVVGAVFEYFKQYKQEPTIAQIKVLLGSKLDDQVRELLDQIAPLIPAHIKLPLTHDQVVFFAKRHAAALYVLKKADEIKSGNFDFSDREIAEINNIGHDSIINAIEITKDIDYYLTEDDDRETAIKTGFRHLDNLISGGLQPGELGVILGPTSGGKSIALVNIAAAVCDPISAKNVLYITLELSSKKLGKRFAANFSGRFRKYGEALENYKSLVLDNMGVRKEGRLFVADFVARHTSMYDIKTYIEELEALHELTIDLIIIDYIDLMALDVSASRRDVAIGDLYLEFIAMLKETNKAGWTVSQTNRDGVSKEVITLKDIAESFQKAQHADLVLALCQTVKETQQNKARFYMAKVRDHPGIYNQIELDFNRDAMSMVTTRLMEPGENERDDLLANPSIGSKTKTKRNTATTQQSVDALVDSLLSSKAKDKEND